MARLIDVISNFTGGELSTLLEGRFDLKKFQTSLYTCKNFIPKPHGPITRRPGTKFVGHTRNNETAYLYKFVFNTSTSYILEFTDNILRFYKEQALVLKSSGSSDFVNGDFPSDIASWTDSSTGTSSLAHNAVDERLQLVCDATGQAEARQSVGSLVPHQYTVSLDVYDESVTYKVGTTSGASDLGTGTLTTGTGKAFKFYSGSNTTVHFSFVNDETNTTAEIDNIELSASPYEIATPWTVAEISEANFAQSADLLYIAHNRFKTRLLARSDDDDWTISEAEFKDGPYLDQNVTSVGPIVSYPNTFITKLSSLTGSHSILASTSGVFTSDDVGRHIRMRSSPGLPYGWGIITGYTDSQTVTVDFKTPVDGTQDVVNGEFTEGIYGWATTSGSPAWSSGTLELDSTDAVSQTYIADFANTYKVEITKTSGAGTVQIGIGDTSSNDAVTTYTTITGTTTIEFTTEAPGEEVFINIKSTTGTSYVDNIKIYTEPSDTTDWLLGAWGNRPTLGYPKAVRFYEQRLVLAGSIGQPQTFWASQTAAFENFSPDGDENNDDITTISALNYTLADEQLNTINTISAQGALIFHTSGPIFVASAAEAGAISPTNISVVPAVNESSASNIRAVSTATTTIGIHSSRKIIYDLAYEFEKDGYNTRPLSRLADHLMESPINSIAIQDTPDKIIWFTRDDGVLLGLTYERDENVIAWSKHELGGTDVKCLQVETIPSDIRTETWVQVERTINGSTVRYIEVLQPEFRFQDIKDAFFVDSGLTYEGSSAIMISGLNHLEGETVKIMRDGIPDPDQVVSNGTITLTKAATKVHVGLGYESIARTHDIEVQTSSFPTIQGVKRRIFQASLKFMETVGAQYGVADNGTFTNIPFQKINDPFGVAPELYSGIKTIPELNFGYAEEEETGKQIVIKQDNVYPMTLLAIITRVEAHDF